MANTGFMFDALEKGPRGLADLSRLGGMDIGRTKTTLASYEKVVGKMLFNPSTEQVALVSRRPQGSGWQNIPPTWMPTPGGTGRS